MKDPIDPTKENRVYKETDKFVRKVLAKGGTQHSEETIKRVVKKTYDSLPEVDRR